jgi:hypothetical protein
VSVILPLLSREPDPVGIVRLTGALTMAGRAGCAGDGVNDGVGIPSQLGLDFNEAKPCCMDSVRFSTRRAVRQYPMQKSLGGVALLSRKPGTVDQEYLNQKSI